MKRKPLILIALVASVVGALFLNSAFAGTNKPTRIPDCTGKLKTKPKNVILTCADANTSASKLKWIGWRGSRAVALGTGSVNDCDPNCASGKVVKAEIVLVATGKQKCGKRYAYRKVQYTYFESGPNFQPGIVTFRC